MAKVPPVELIESTHTFPGKFTFKVIGESSPAFEARVVAAVREALKSEADPPYTLRSSSGGKHLAITLEPEVQTAQQVIDVFQKLSRTPGVSKVL